MPEKVPAAIPSPQQLESCPATVAFGVMETFFPIDSLREPLVELGLPPQALETWFARTLRDGFALAAGTFRPFAEVATGTLRGLLAEHGRPPDPSAAPPEPRGQATGVAPCAAGRRDSCGPMPRGTEAGIQPTAERLLSLAA